MRFISNENSEHIKYHTVHSSVSVTTTYQHLPMHQHTFPFSQRQDSLIHKEQNCLCNDGGRVEEQPGKVRNEIGLMSDYAMQGIGPADVGEHDKRYRTEP